MCIPVFVIVGCLIGALPSDTSPVYKRNTSLWNRNRVLAAYVGG